MTSVLWPLPLLTRLSRQWAWLSWPAHPATLPPRLGLLDLTAGLSQCSGIVLALRNVC